MIIFWSLIGLLTLLAIGFICYPLLVANSKQGSRPSYVLAVILSAATVMLGLSIYCYWGKGILIADLLAKNHDAGLAKQQLAKFGSRENVVIALRAQLEKLPMDANAAKGWYILGKLYFNDKNYPEAISAFDKAARLKPTEPDYLLQLVSAKFYIHHRLDDNDKRLINALIKSSPQNINAINLLALDAYQQGQYAVATRHWESLLQYFPPDSEDSKALLEMIRQSQQHLLTKSSLDEIKETQKEKVKVNVIVTTATEYKSAIKPSDTLFVYALPMEGPKIPLAVVRTTANHFPVNLTLDESQSMIPGRSLATVNRYYIEARVSKSGNAKPEEGDLVGKSEEVKQGEVKVKLNSKIGFRSS